MYFLATTLHASKRIGLWFHAESTNLKVITPSTADQVKLGPLWKTVYVVFNFLTSHIILEDSLKFSHAQSKKKKNEKRHNTQHKIKKNTEEIKKLRKMLKLIRCLCIF